MAENGKGEVGVMDDILSLARILATVTAALEEVEWVQTGPDEEERCPWCHAVRGIDLHWGWCKREIALNTLHGQSDR